MVTYFPQVQVSHTGTQSPGKTTVVNSQEVIRPFNGRRAVRRPLTECFGAQEVDIFFF